MKNVFRMLLFGSLFAALALAVGFGLRTFTEGRKPAPKNFAAITAIAPLFYAPDIDTAAWKREVKELEKLSAIMNRMYRDLKARGRANEPYASRYDEIAPYPVRFLRAVPDVIRKTDAFFSHPTRGNADRLLAAYRKAAAAYRGDAERFADLARTAAEANPDARLVFIGSATTPEIVKNDAALLLQNADALDREIAKRAVCLAGGACELNVKKVKIASRPPQFVPSPPDVMQYYETLRQAERRGPFFYPSHCWHNENGAPTWELFYVLFPQNPAGEKTIGIKLATENYYNRMQSGTRSALTQTFVEKGLDFFSTVEANPYRCTDLDYWQALLTMNWLEESLKQEPISAGLSESVKRLEDAYRSARYPSWDVTLELANAYQELLLGGNSDNAIAARHQMLRGRLAEFPTTLAALNDLAAFFLKIARADKALPIDYFVQIASYFPLTFMNFSDAVWLLDVKPVYLLSGYQAPVNTELPDPGEILPAERNVFTLSVLRQYLSEEQILDIHRKTSEANREIDTLPLE